MSPGLFNNLLLSQCMGGTSTLGGSYYLAKGFGLSNQNAFALAYCTQLQQPQPLYHPPPPPPPPQPVYHVPPPVVQQPTRITYLDTDEVNKEIRDRNSQHRERRKRSATEENAELEADIQCLKKRKLKLQLELENHELTNQLEERQKHTEVKTPVAHISSDSEEESN